VRNKQAYKYLFGNQVNWWKIGETIKKVIAWLIFAAGFALIEYLMCTKL